MAQRKLSPTHQSLQILWKCGLKDIRVMIGLIMEKAHGLPRRPSREQLEGLAKDEAFVIVHPIKFSEN